MKYLLAGIGFVMVFGFWLALIGAWITHVIVCIQSALWVLLGFGCIIFPVGIIHGVGVWLGAF